MPHNHIPAGFHTVNPYLTVKGAAQVIDFLTKVFEAQVLMRMDGPDGSVAHAALKVGDSMIETAEAHGEWKSMPAGLHVYVPDVDLTYRRAMEAGAKSLRAPENMFYGERGASVEDLVGNYWHIATKTEDLTVEEMNRRAEVMFGGKK